jgi:hypothetical protein
MNQIVEPLNQNDAADLEAKRTWVRDHYEPESRGKYETVEGKLNLVAEILSQGWIAPGETLKLQCLGITFGDAVAQQLGLAWVAVEDDFGRDPALRVNDSGALTFPMTAISKRAEQGESVNVHWLFNDAVATIRVMTTRAS